MPAILPAVATAFGTEFTYRDLSAVGRIILGWVPSGPGTVTGGPGAAPCRGRDVSSSTVYTETALFDLLLPGDSRSLKEKRSYVRPIVAALRRLEVSVAEVGALDLHGRAQLGVAVVAADAAHARRVVDACEHLVAGRPEVELLSVRRRLHGADD